MENSQSHYFMYHKIFIAQRFFGLMTIIIEKCFLLGESQEEVYNQKDAEGFINLFGLPMKVQAKINKV